MNSSRTFLNYLETFFVLLLSLGALMTGVMKVVPMQAMLDGMAGLNYSIEFLRFIGLCWILGGIGIWVRKYRLLACLGMSAICFGAIATHITAGHPLEQAMGATLYLLVALIILSLNGFWKKNML